MSFSAFFCARFIWSRLHNDLLFLIQTRFFIMSLRMMMSEKALLMEIAREIGRKKKSFETVQISFFRIAWCDCLMCKRQASSPSGIRPPLNLLTRVSN